MPKTKLGRPTAEQVTAAATGGAVLVHSVQSRKDLPKVSAASLLADKSTYECSHCSTKVTASTHAAPACVSCGSPTEKVSASANPKVGAVVAVECRHCQSVHLMEANVVKASGYHLHCSVCGEANDYQKQASKIEAALKAVTAEAESEEDEDDVSADDLAGELCEPAPEEPAAEEEPKAEEASGDDWPFDGEEPAEASAEGEDSFVDSGEDLEVAAEADSLDGEEDLSLELEDLDEPVAATNVDDMPSVDASQEDPSLDEEIAAEYEAPDLDTGDTLADVLEIDDTDAGLTLAVSAGRVVAMKGHVSVASLKKENAGSNKDVMTTAGFLSAVQHLVKKNGMRKALASVGFKPVRIQTLTAASVARKVQEAQQTAVNSSAEKTASFTESIALAAAGLSRGAWKGKKNPLQAALIEELRTIGAKNPERIVARVLADQFVPTAKVLVEIASELNSMSSNARKETASILGMTEAVVASAEPEDEDDTEIQASADLKGRLSSTAAVLPSVLSTSLNLGPRDASRQQIQAAATSRALSILEGDEPLMLG